MTNAAAAPTARQRLAAQVARQSTRQLAVILRQLDRQIATANQATIRDFRIARIAVLADLNARLPEAAARVDAAFYAAGAGTLSDLWLAELDALNGPR